MIVAPANKPARVFHLPGKLACITMDFETDYGDRIGEFNILRHNRKDIEELGRCFDDLRVPVSAFIQTNLLKTYPQCAGVIESLARDYHCHSHTHNTRSFDSEREIAHTRAAFEEHFGEAPLGYRAPQGVLYEGDTDLLRKHGFRFSASIFPSYRPRKFNNLGMPIRPFEYRNGLLELPFAVIPRLRYTISLSYLKLVGFAFSRFLFSIGGLPNPLVFDSHLHDFIVNDESFDKLPPSMRFAWGINRYSGRACFEQLVAYLRRRDYQFVTMTELSQRVSECCS